MSAPVAPQAVRVYQSEVLDKPRISNIFVPCHVNKGGTIMYLIRVRTRVASWNVQRRYREIHELHQQLKKQFSSLRSDLFPPKKAFGNTSEEFLETRRQQLELYLQHLIRSLQPHPKELLDFLIYKLIDVATVTRSLASDISENGDQWLSQGSVMTVSPLQLHCITKQLALPMESAGHDASYLGHLYDFLYQLKTVKILPEKFSIVVVEELPQFDFAVLKSLTGLVMQDIDIESCHGVDSLRCNLESVEIHRTVPRMKDFFCRCTSVSRDESVVADAVLSDPKLVWNCLRVVDLSYNDLMEIDQSMLLLRNVEELKLSHNKIKTVENLSDLPKLKSLDLSYNEIAIVCDLHTKIGNLSKLILAFNQIATLKGLRKMLSLEALNLMGNCINNVSEVCYLSELPQLTELVLKENPICQSQMYQIEVLTALRASCLEVVLDGAKPTQDQLERAESLRHTMPQQLGSNSSPTCRIRKPQSQVRIASISAMEELVPEDLDASLADSLTLSDRMTKMRHLGGDKWLSILKSKVTAKEVCLKPFPKMSAKPSPKSSPKPSPKPSPKSSSKLPKQTVAKQQLTKGDLSKSSTCSMQVWNPAEALSAFALDEALEGPELQMMACNRPDPCNPVFQAYFQNLVNREASTSTSVSEVLNITFWGIVILCADPLQPFNALVYLSNSAIYICEVLRNACSRPWSRANELPLKLVMSSPLGRLRKCSFGMNALCFTGNNPACTFSLLTFSPEVTEEVITVLQSHASDEEVQRVVVTDTTREDVVALCRELQGSDLTLSCAINNDSSEADVDIAVCMSLIQIQLSEAVDIALEPPLAPVQLIALVNKGGMLYICQVNHLLGPGGNLGDMKVATKKYMLQTCLPLSHLRLISMVDAQFVYRGSLFPLYALVLGFSNGTHWKLFCCSQAEGDRLVQLLQESSGKDVTISHSSDTSILSANVAQVQSDGAQDGTECGSHTELEYLYSCLRRRSKSDLSATLHLISEDAKDAREELIHVFYAHFLPYSSTDDLFEVIVALTNQHIHLVSSNVTAQRWNMSFGAMPIPVSTKCNHDIATLLSVPFSDVTEVSIGLFDQSLRITSQDSAVVFSLITGEELVTESILDHLKKYVSHHQAQIQKSVFRYSETLEYDKLKSCLDQTLDSKGLMPCETTHIFGYLVVHKNHLNNGTPCSVVMRTLVLTSVCLHVLKEDYVRWPLLPTMGMLPNWDRHQVERSCFLSHIQGIAVSSPTSSSFCVVMTQADGDALAEEQLIETASMPCNSVQAASVEWQFVAASYLQREKFLNRLREAWESVHKKALPIILHSQDSVP